MNSIDYYIWNIEFGIWKLDSLRSQLRTIDSGSDVLKPRPVSVAVGQPGQVGHGAAAAAPASGRGSRGCRPRADSPSRGIAGEVRDDPRGGCPAGARRTAQYFSSGCLAIRPVAEMVK